MAQMSDDERNERRRGVLEKIGENSEPLNELAREMGRSWTSRAQERPEYLIGADGMPVAPGGSAEGVAPTQHVLDSLRHCM